MIFFGEVNHDYDDQGFYRYSCDEDEYYATQVYLMLDYTTTEQVVQNLMGFNAQRQVYVHSKIRNFIWLLGIAMMMFQMRSKPKPGKCNISEN